MDILSFSEMRIKERVDREAIDPKTICTFGIRPLDEALYGILRNDLIVIGADSGSGKSELCLDIALHNARNGKKVVLYFIEGGASEAMSRIKWKLMCQRFFAEKRTGIYLDYRKWRMNMHDQPEVMASLEEEACDIIEDTIDGNLFFYDFDKTFTIEHLIESFRLVGYSDLIVVDHLQYFDISEPRSELKEMSDILKRLKDIANFEQIPVILVSHLRKKDKDRGLPSQEDFYGTSNIAKISSVSITISSEGKQVEDFALNIYPTWFRIVKSRTKVSSNLGMLCNFELTNQRYAQEYDVWRLFNGIPTKVLSDSEKPRWAKSAKAVPVVPAREETRWDE
jgi:replicative DNA helicase